MKVDNYPRDVDAEILIINIVPEGKNVRRFSLFFD